MNGEEEHEITPEVIEQAKKMPGGNVFKVAGEWAEEETIPGAAVVGGWKVNERGNIFGNFIPNPNFDPKLKERRINKSD